MTDPTTVSEALMAIQRSLSLTATELAKVMSVDPGTIRRWTNGDVDPPEDAARKLLTIRSVASEWNARSDLPLRRETLSQVGRQRRPLVDLLAEAPLDMPAISEHLNEYRRLVAIREASASPWPRSMREIALENGIEPIALCQGDDLIDVITGRPMYRD